MKSNKLSRRLLGLPLALLCSLCVETATGREDTPPENRTGAPPSGNTCASCHDGSGTGSVSLSFSGGTAYTPGGMFSLMVTVTDLGKARFGFSMVARDADQNTVDAGTWSAGSADTQAYGSGHVGHLNAPFEDDSHTFTVNWAAPATGVGNVIFYVAGVAADGLGDDGPPDVTYLNTLTITETSPTPPVLSDLLVLENGSAQFMLTGTPGLSYTVEYSDNLSAWNLLEVTPPLVSNTTTITDNGASGHPARFYRATQNGP